MSYKCEQVHDFRLRAAGCQEEYDLHLAALEWTLTAENWSGNLFSAISSNWGPAFTTLKWPSRAVR